MNKIYTVCRVIWHGKWNSKIEVYLTLAVLSHIRKVAKCLKYENGHLLKTSLCAAKRFVSLPITYFKGKIHTTHFKFKWPTLFIQQPLSWVLHRYYQFKLLLFLLGFQNHESVVVPCLLHRRHLQNALLDR